MKRWVVLLALAMTSPVAAKTSTAVLVMRQGGPSGETDLKVRDHLAGPTGQIRLPSEFRSSGRFAPRRCLFCLLQAAHNLRPSDSQTAAGREKPTVV